ncbi:hypothetical protein CWATWH0003_0469 [Crocosphaera watsonii WH 0003]|uniref:Adenylate kinase n=2 Tax=Crocosphaera watsonii TaxID=263511 RepID=G5IYW6_CROWT|nr:hypothetical protein CWATWH0003_0469 [Crocosphaera watsonii WH 0003]CCQ57261.1 conserved hypothetical protein [Crocosphaera watsonii WH 0005]
MKKVAVFGNTGGGKSTLSRKLSEMTNLPLYVLDKFNINLEVLRFLMKNLNKIMRKLSTRMNG